MKVGSLVELSAYGKKIKILESYVGDIGLVLTSHFESALVQWTQKSRPRHMNRRDIKHVRSKK